jgi:hypothetical protein
MAKKQTAPDAIIKQFSKSQFKTGDAVFFTWLGAKKYGYVKHTKETGWGVQYMVESNDTRYPCGISIKGHKTAYTTGCIDVDETRSIGQDEIRTRIQTGHSSTYTELFTDTRRTEDESRSKSDSSKRISTSNSKAIKSTRSNNTRKDVVKSSPNGNNTGARKKRGDSELDDAIQRQRDFLNGFIKKD